MTLVGRQVLHDVCDVGWMELGQPIMRNLELHAARWIGFDQIDEIPWDVARWNFPQQSVQRRFWRHTTKEPAHRSTRAHVDRKHTKNGIRASRVLLRTHLKINIINPHDLAAVDVNHLLVQQVVLQQEYPLSSIDLNPIDPAPPSFHPP